MRTIYKYQIPVLDNPIIKLPVSANILKVGAVGSDMWLWALVDTNSELVDVKLRIVGTGHPIMEEEHLKHIGSVLMYEGSLVWHVFLDLTSLYKIAEENIEL